MDRNGDGELDLGEICEVLDEMATVEKQRRLLKWVAGIMGVFTLLSIAAIVGLTFAVVDLSKDTSLSEGGVLQSRSGDATVATGQVISVQNLTDVYKLASADLQSITSLVIPEGDGERVVKVVEAFSVPGTSVTFTSATGAQYTVDAAGMQVEDGAGGRRLADLGCSSNYVRGFGGAQYSAPSYQVNSAPAHGAQLPGKSGAHGKEG